jgi:hypothetical protein
LDLVFIFADGFSQFELAKYYWKTTFTTRISMKLIFFTILALNICHAAFSQRIVSNSYLPDVDEPFRRNKKMVENNFRVIRYYDCPDSFFSKSQCRCTVKEIYNDSGGIIKLQKGKNIDNGLLHYTVNYVSTTDTICEVIAVFTARYADSVPYFHIDTVVRGKNERKSIYPKEPNGGVYIKCSVYFDKGDNSIAHKVLRFDRNNVLREIYYPLGGNRPIIKSATDSVLTSISKTYYYHAYYQENEYHSFKKISLKGQILETGYSNITYNSGNDSQRTIYLYNDSSQLVYKYTVNDDNQVTQAEEYFYENSCLVKYRRNSDFRNTGENELRVYDADGQLLELTEKGSWHSDPIWRWNYIYEHGLQVRTDYFLNDKFLKSMHLKYGRD